MTSLNEVLECLNPTLEYFRGFKKHPFMPLSFSLPLKTENHEGGPKNNHPANMSKAKDTPSISPCRPPFDSRRLDEFCNQIIKSLMNSAFSCLPDMSFHQKNVAITLLF